MKREIMNGDNQKRESAYRFGEKLRKVRERRGLTLRTVAKGIGVSDSLLSQIETNRVSPSIDTLLLIADFLEVDVEYLFRDYQKERKVKVIHLEERDKITLDDVVYEQLTPLSDPGDEFALEMLQISIHPGGQKGSKEYGHPGREMGVILQGVAELDYGRHQYTLVEGDSVSFSSKIPHVLKNKSDSELKVLWIVSPPRMFAQE